MFIHFVSKEFVLDRVNNLVEPSITLKFIALLIQRWREEKCYKTVYGR